jgi:DNA polymerase III subunit delta'
MLSKLAHPDLHLTFPIFLGERSKTCESQLPEWRAAVAEEPYLDAELWRQRLDGENKQLRMGVDIAQEIVRKLGLKAYSGGWKVVLLWLPELMDNSAANKLLKALEEPEPNTAFLFAGHEPEHLLPTILSRVQLVKVPALDTASMVTALAERFPDLKPEEGRSIALRSQGDLLQAFAMAEKNEEELFAFFRDWLRACYGVKVAELAEFAEQFAKGYGRERQKATMRYGLYLFRQCAYLWQGVPDLTAVDGAEREFAQKFSALLNERNVDLLRTHLEAAHGHLERNANPRVLFMDLSYQLGRALRA